MYALHRSACLQLSIINVLPLIVTLNSKRMITLSQLLEVLVLFVMDYSDQGGAIYSIILVTAK